MNILINNIFSKKSKKIIFVIILIFIPFFSFAENNIRNWRIKELETLIVVDKNSSLLVTEKITADADNLFNKHGIFRTLPTQIKTIDKVFKVPIKLISITDFDGSPLKYKTIKNRRNNTITWKIGDSNITVKGLNHYKIVYRVKNAIRFDNPNFDEFYWNLLGTFWKLDIDNFRATIIFPENINKGNTEVNYYTGYLGEKRKNLAGYQWIEKNILRFLSSGTIKKKEGITVSVTFPKNIFTPSKLSFVEKYGDYLKYLWLLLPIAVFIVCFIIWLKYGKDPNIGKTIIPEFEIPGNLSPMQIGLLISGGKWNNRLIPASVINMAVKGFISIKEAKLPNNIIGLAEKLFNKKDFLLKNLSSENKKINLAKGDKALMDRIFQGEKEVSLSSLKDNFPKKFKEIKKIAINDLFDSKLITRKGLLFQKIFLTIGIFTIFFFLEFLFSFFNGNFLFISVCSSALIILFFSLIMPKRTKRGAELLWRIKGFKLYMKTAEKHRQQFYEEENIFEKFLPYAIVFGMAKLWIKKMEKIYGPDFIKNYHPIWITGASFSTFNVNNFTSTLDSLSSGIASNTGTSSGAGGGGGVGGGGGGGGGGGW